MLVAPPLVAIDPRLEPVNDWFYAREAEEFAAQSVAAVGEILDDDGLA